MLLLSLKVLRQICQRSVFLTSVSICFLVYWVCFIYGTLGPLCTQRVFFVRFYILVCNNLGFISLLILDRLQMVWVFIMNRMSSQSSSSSQRRRMALGIVILLLVDVIWVASSELTSVSIVLWTLKENKSLFKRKFQGKHGHSHSVDILA